MTKLGYGNGRNSSGGMGENEKKFPIIQEINHKKVLYIPDDLTIFEFFDVVYQIISNKYGGNIPKDHPIFDYVNKIFDFGLQFILQSTQIIEINNRPVKRKEIIASLKKSQLKVSKDCLALFNSNFITKSRIMNILQKDVFTPDSFHDQFENMMYCFTEKLNQYDIQELNLDYYQKKVYNLIALHKYDEALFEAKIGIELFGEDYELLLYMGECYYFKNEEKTAIIFFESAISIDQFGSQAIGYLCVIDYPKTLYKLEEGSLEVNELMSKRLLKKALNAYKNDTDSYNLLIVIGKLNYNLKNYKEAAKYLEIFNLLFPGEFDNFTLLIDSYELSEQYDKAIECLIADLPNNPNNKYFWEKIGQYLTQIQDISLAQQFLYISSRFQKLDFGEKNIDNKNIIDQFLEEKNISGLIRYLYSKIT